MVRIKGLKAFIACENHAEEISIPSNHSMSVEEGSKYIYKKKNSFYRIDRPEFEMSNLIKTETKNSQSSKSNSSMEKEIDSFNRTSNSKQKNLNKSHTQDLISDFSKKAEGYESFNNIKETGNEFREDGEQIKCLFSMKKELKKESQIIDDIELELDRSFDSHVEIQKNKRKTSEHLWMKKEENICDDILDDVQAPKIQDEDLFNLSKKNLDEFIQKKLYSQFDKEKLFLYLMKDLQKKEAIPQIGLICCVHYKDYTEKKIKVHEKTLDQTIERLTKLYKALGAYTGFPILFSEFGDIYSEIHNIVNTTKSVLSVKMDNYLHEIYEVPEKFNYNALAYFKNIPNIYVADGHHRLKAYTTLIEKMHQESENSSLQSVFVTNPDTLPVICEPHSMHLIKQSLKSEFNKQRIKDAKNKEQKPSLIIWENKSKDNLEESKIN